MELTYLGHSCFKVTSYEGTSLIFDPYTPGGSVRHRPLPDVVDGVVVSHSHPGHSCTSLLQGHPEVFYQSGYLGTMELTAVPTFHDVKKGRKFGANTVWRVTVDSLSICHLGDIGHMPTNDQLVDIIPTDILLCPVGGIHSLDAEQATTIIGLINPMIVIPMHYWTPLIGRQLHRIERFLHGRSHVVPFNGSTINVTSESIPANQPTWVLRPLY